MRIREGVLVLGLILVAAPLGAQSAARVTFGGRAHFQWSTTSVDPGDAGSDSPVASSTFETRRVRLSADVAVGDWIRGRVEPEFTLGQLDLKQAWMSFMLDSAFVVRAGQFKKPFGAINLQSSAELPVIERGVRIRGLEGALAASSETSYGELHDDMLVGEQHALLDGQMYAGYDQGVVLEGERGAVAWSAGAFNGSGPDTRDGNDAKSFAGRATVVVGPMTLGGAYSHRELNWPTASAADTRSGSAFAVDAELGGFRRGLWLIAEAAAGDNLATEESFRAAHVIVAWFRRTGSARVEGVEPVARVSWGDPDDTVDGDAGVLLTPGVNLYFAGRNRFMLNWDVYVPQADDAATRHALRAQFNLHF